MGWVEMELGDVPVSEQPVPQSDELDELDAPPAAADTAAEDDVEVTAEAVGVEAVQAPAIQAAPRAVPETPVAAAMRELETLGERDLAEHPDVYQRIHAELQSALATIDNA